MRIAICLLIALTFSSPAIAQDLWPGDSWAQGDAAATLNVKQLERARDYALTAEGAGLVIVGGKEVMSWGDRRQRYDLKSTTKSFGATALGIALLDGKVKLADPAIKYQPALGVPPESN